MLSLARQTPSDEKLSTVNLKTGCFENIDSAIIISTMCNYARQYKTVKTTVDFTILTTNFCPFFLQVLQILKLLFVP